MPANDPSSARMPIAWISTGVVRRSLPMRSSSETCSLLGSAMSFSQRSAASPVVDASTMVEKCRCVSSAAVNPVSRSMASERYVNMPSRSVAKTTSGEFSTRNR